MKQYLTSLALLIAALVAFPTSHANAQSETEMNRQAAKPTIRYETMAELTQQRIKQLKTTLTDGAALNEKEANTPTPRPTATSSTSTQDRDEKPAAAAPSPSFVSPDKKWEFRVDKKGNPQIVRTGKAEVAVELYDKCGPGLDNCKPPLWAPDSKRFAMNVPNKQGRYNPTWFYQLKGDKWEELDDGLNDALDQVLEKAIAAQMKKRGLRKKTELRLISNPFKTINWLDSDTALVYGSKGELVLGNADVGFAAYYLFTIKFDEAGNSKIVKTQHLSEKESKKFEDDSHD